MKLFQHTTLNVLLIFGIILILQPGAAWAQDPNLKLGKPLYQDGKVLLDVELQEFFTKDSLASLQSGIPATLNFQWTVFQQREGWIDPKVATGQVRNRIFFDVLEEQYHLFNHQGRPLGACDGLAGIAQALCRREAMVLPGVGNLKNDVQYYVEMEVSLEILNDKKVRGFEEWLLGDGAGASDSPEDQTTDELKAPEEDSGFSSGLSDIVLGTVLKITGISDKTVIGQSPLFFR